MPRNGTTFEFSAAERGKPADVLIVPLAARPRPALERLTRVDKLCEDAVSALVGIGAPGDEPGQISHTAGAGPYRRVIVVSLGDSERIDAARIRTAAAATARWLVSEKITRAALWIDALISAAEEAAAEWSVGMALAGFRFEELRETDPKSPANIRVQILAGEVSHVDHALGAIKSALIEADAVNFARRIAHQPANVIHPGTLSDEARKLAKEVGLKCTILAEPELRKLKMGGLLAVGRGAKVGPRLIQLEYHGNPKSKAVHVLIGKAITFDTGGYSLKLGDSMVTMKFDKCGGCAVLGALRAVARLKLRCNVTGVIAAAENMVSAEAYRPGDILTMMSGKTVEIISTDAEGRLVLADALWYAQQKLNPATIVDLATLTGGVRNALGTAAAGLMSNNDTLAGDLGEAGRRVHERLWRLPLWDEYREAIKAQDSDIKNSAGKPEALAIVGGMFLKEFVKNGTSWAHLDIAAVATRDDPRLPTGKGATGFGVRLLVEFLRGHSG